MKLLQHSQHLITGTSSGPVKSVWVIVNNTFHPRGASGQKLEVELGDCPIIRIHSSRLCSYHLETGALAGAEVPAALVRVTLTEPMSDTLPCTENGCVYRKVLPNCVDCVPVYQVVKVLLTGTGTWEVPSSRPGAGVKANTAWVTSREVEYPVISTLKPPPVCETVMAVMTGADRDTRMVRVGAIEGRIDTSPAERLVTVRVTVPATVPVPRTPFAAVLPALMVNESSLWPFENFFAGSSEGFTASGAKLSVTFPEMLVVYAAPSCTLNDG